jgi:hypothetical protein
LLSAVLAALLTVTALQVALTDDATPPQGLWLHSALSGGVVGGDPVVDVEAGIGIDTTPFSVHLDVPVALRIVDLPPAVDPSFPPQCRWVRCEEWLDAGKVSAESLARVVESVRLFQPGDVVHAKGGRIFASLGHGSLVDEYTNASDWDRRHSGVYSELNFDAGHTQISALTGDVVAPQDFFGARVSMSPLAKSGDEARDGDTLSRFLGRMTLGFEGAADLDAPLKPVDRNGDVVPGSPSRPVYGFGADLTWPLLDDGFAAIQIAPWLDTTLTGGLGSNTPGFGGALGVDVTSDAVFVAVRASASVLLDGPGHRFGIFDTLYDVDRRSYATLGGVDAQHRDNFSRNGIATLDEQGGVGVDASGELVVMRFVHVGARLHDPAVAEDRRAETWLGVDVAGVRVDARIVQRDLSRPNDVLAFGNHTYLVADASWQVFAPFSLFARWQHEPRFHSGFPIADDDVLVGASFDLVLSPS